MGTTRAEYVGNTLEFYDDATHERVDRLAPIAFVDDFLGADTVIPAAGSPESGTKWVKKIVGAAPPTLGAVADGVNGVIECALTADDQKQNAEIYFNDELQFSMLQGLVFEARFAASVLPTVLAEIVVGFVGAWADGLDAATYSCFVTLDGSGEIICELDDNAADQSATSGVTLTASQYCVVRIDTTVPTDVKFFVNGARVASGTTFSWDASAANSKVQPIAGCYKVSGAGVATLLLDYVKVWQNRA
jgi:hypothetical protein